MLRVPFNCYDVCCLMNAPAMLSCIILDSCDLKYVMYVNLLKVFVRRDRIQKNRARCNDYTMMLMNG